MKPITENIIEESAIEILQSLGWDYAKHFGLTDKTAQRRIASLFEKGLLEKEGENRWIKYRIKK